MIYRRACGRCAPTCLGPCALAAAIAGAMLNCGAAAAGGPGDEGIAFFEARIRPVLTAQCFECHSAGSKPLQGKFRVDSAAALRRGGESGPAIVPGKPDESPLLAALAHDGSFVDMPPKGKLPADVLADFRRWIALGAPDPRVEAASNSLGAAVRAMTAAEATRHWAYQPIRKPLLPKSASAAWIRMPIDAFISAKLEAAGLKPSALADPRTLIRRLAVDLTGLPPSYEEVEAFARDFQGADPTGQSGANAALEKLVDRLLASPHYGERWGRHWLDVARYADTKDGVLMYGDARLRPHAFTYRDYVVAAFNADLPFDRFVVEQLAADLIEPKGSAKAQAAMGFLTLGRMFDLNAHDIIDDQIDTVTRGLLGLTVSCARCHDHKYDAIPTQDYYALYGVFARSEPPIEPPIVGASNAKVAGFAEFQAKDAAARQNLTKLLDEQFALLTEFERTHAGDYLFDIATVKPDPLENAIFFRSLSPGELRPLTLARWRQYLQKVERDDVVFGPWRALLELATLPPAEPDRLDREAPQKLDKPDPGIERRAAAVIAAFARRPRGSVHPVVLAHLQSATIRSRGDVARAYGRALASSYESVKRRGATPAERRLVDLLTSPDGPAYFPKSSTWYYMARAEKDRFHGLRTELDILAAKYPHAPPRAMCLVDCASPMPEPRVHVRGNPTVLGETVARHFVSILQDGKPKPFGPGSGRLDLARAIVDPANPLTARVLVNRVWMHHMGEPLVATPSDFGARGSAPTHPELLDWLAARFMESGWSLKKLHREIVLSATYLQASVDRPECRAVDADNRLWWRAMRRRLDFESMRDAMLTASGRLDRALYGRPADIAADPKNARRTLYALVDRQSLPTVFRAFDFANPDQSIDRRPFTTVPQQALFALNAPFVAEQARALAERAAAPAVEPGRAVEMLFERVLARRPTAPELALAASFLDLPRDALVQRGETGGIGLPPAASAGAGGKARPRPSAARWEQFAQMLLASNEFTFCD